MIIRNRLKLPPTVASIEMHHVGSFYKLFQVAEIGRIMILKNAY